MINGQKNTQCISVMHDNKQDTILSWNPKIYLRNNRLNHGVELSYDMQKIQRWQLKNMYIVLSHIENIWRGWENYHFSRPS